MDIIQNSVLHREGKKWKSRWAVLKRISPASNSDLFMLVFYKDTLQAKEKRRHKQVVPLLEYAGSKVLDKVEKVENVLVIITESQTSFMSFDSVDVRDAWFKILQEQFGQETTYQVTVPSKQKLKTGEATLRVYNNFFSLTNNKSLRCTGRWLFCDVHRYAAVDSSAFLFEIATKSNENGYLYRLTTGEGDEIVQLFDYVSSNQDNGAEMVKPLDFHGSSLLVDLDTAKRNPTDPNFFQRCLLRVSNRIRKHKRERSRTYTGPKPRTRKSNDQNVTVEENGATGLSRKREQPAGQKEKGNLSEFTSLPDEVDEKPKKWKIANRSSSFAHFGTDPGRARKYKEGGPFQDSNKNNSFCQGGTPPLPSTPTKTVPTKPSTSSKHSMSSKPSVSSAAVKESSASVGSGSALSNISRGASVYSEVFDDEPVTSPAKGSSQQNQDGGPPVAPPRSPVSLGMFEFPSSHSGGVQVESSSTGKGGIPSQENPKNGNNNNIESTKRSTTSSEGEVRLRREGGLTLLEEIDKEVKRRTRELSSSSTPSPRSSPVQSPGRFSKGRSSPVPSPGDNSRGRSSPIASPSKTTRGRSSTSSSSKVYIGAMGGARPKENDSTPVQVSSPTKKLSSSFDHSETSRNSFDQMDGVVAKTGGSQWAGRERGSTENIRENEPYSKKSVREAVTLRNHSSSSDGRKEDGVMFRRSTSRRGSSKHLSDPLVLEHLNIAQDNMTGGSMRELTQAVNYVNVKGKNCYDDDNSGSYVNVSKDAKISQQPKKKSKPKPLNLWEKYDDDDHAIYHHVGPLVNNGTTKSGSADCLSQYANLNNSAGSYENIGGRKVKRERPYINVPSPTSKTPSALNYVMFGGPKGSPTSLQAMSNSPKAKSLPSASPDSHKLDYTMIDEKATNLLSRTRNEHWQRREEDAQAKTPRKSR